MIKSALAKLTLYYLAIIMAISLSFSLVIYQVSANELNRNYSRPPVFVSFSNLLDAYSGFARDRLTEAQNRLKLNLLLFNFTVLVTGGAASYLLARRTLRPIGEAFAAQSQFTADASHELRTPLTAMQTEIEVALRNKQLSTKDARALLASNLEEVSKLKSLANALLQLAQNGDQLPSLQKTPVQDVIDTAIERLQTQAGKKKIHINHEPTPLLAVADKDMLTEALTILLDNAVKYSPAKSSIAVGAKADSHNVIIAVTDQGQGIAPEDMPHIFDRFYRSDQSRNKDGNEGFGLGLSIAERIMRLHSGRVQVLSKPGSGSTFSLVVPVANS